MHPERDVAAEEAVELAERRDDGLRRLVNFETLTLRVDRLSPRQRQFAHLVDPRFFADGINPFRAGKDRADYRYETPVGLEEELFYLHPLMDPSVLEQGAVRRFPSGVNERYITEKYVEDKWVSEGNNELSLQLETYLKDHIDRLRAKDRIRLLDVGPCGGAITTLFALRALDRAGLLEKTEIVMLDIVPNVLEATLLGAYAIPEEMVREYGLSFVGANGETYKKMLGDGVLIGVSEWYAASPENGKSPYTDAALAASSARANGPNRPRVRYYRGDGERLPEELKGSCDIVLSAYTHHHMNLYGRKALCEQMEQATSSGGFVGVADFYVPSFAEYMKWYKPHFEEHGDAPPVECPRVDAATLSSWFAQTDIDKKKTDLQRSFVVSGTKR